MDGSSRMEDRLIVRHRKVEPTRQAERSTADALPFSARCVDRSRDATGVPLTAAVILTLLCEVGLRRHA